MSLNLFIIMSFVIALSYWLEEHTKWITHISGVILIIIIASILGSTGIVPSSTDVYDWQYTWMVPLGIILMLLAFNPGTILKVNKDFISCFIIGTVATTIGGLIAGLIFQKLLPDDYWRISGQLTASFIGGYENAVSVGTGLNSPNDVFLRAFSGDSVLTTLWIMFNIFQGRNIKHKSPEISRQSFSERNLSNSIDITSLSITILVAGIILTLGSYFHAYFPKVPQIVWISLMATLVTFTPLRHRFSGSYIFGSIILSYFIFGCGAISNIPYLLNNASILLFFPTTIVVIHALILFGIARILKINKEIVIVTSQCLIGGPATALALVSARKWDYQFEAISLGLLGYAVGNYFGFGVAWLLK